VFDEDFVFEVRPTTLGRRTLEVILYDFDAYSRHHSIGGVKLPLVHIDLSEKVTLWKGLGPCSEQDAKVSSNFIIIWSQRSKNDLQSQPPHFYECVYKRQLVSTPSLGHHQAIIIEEIEYI